MDVIVWIYKYCKEREEEMRENFIYRGWFYKMRSMPFIGNVTYGEDDKW